MKIQITKKVEDWLMAIIFISTTLVLFLPLASWPVTIFPHFFTKPLWFQVLVSIMLVAYIPLFLTNESLRPKWKNRLIMWPSILVGALVVTSLLGINPMHSFFSDIERMFGVYAYIHLYIFYLIATSVFTKDNFKRLFNYALIASTLTSLLAWWQLYQLRSVAYQVRIESTLGNPFFLGLYLYFAILIALFLYQQSKKKFYLASAIFSFVTIFLTGSKGIFLALLTFAFFYCLLKAFKEKNKHFQIFTISILSLSALFIVIRSNQNLREYSQANFPHIINRLITDDLIDPNRVILTKIGLRGFLAHPIIGYGPENYYAVYQDHHEPGLPLSWYDKSHNGFIDWLATTGIVGFGVYIMVWYFTLKKAYTKKEYLILAGLIGYTVAIFTTFEFIISAIFFYLLLAYLISDEAKPEINLKPWNTNAWLITGFTAVIAIYLSWFYSFIPLKHGNQFGQLLPLMRLDLPYANILINDQLINMPDHLRPSLSYLYGRHLVETNAIKPITNDKTVAKNLGLMEKHFDRYQDDARYHFMIAIVYRLYGNEELAKEHIIEAAQLMPTHEQIILEAQRSVIK